MSSQLAQLQDDRAQYQEQLDLVLSSLRDDPDNADLLVLKEELASALKMIDDSVAELQPEKEKNHTATTTPPPQSTTKSNSRSQHAASPAHEYRGSGRSDDQPSQHQQQPYKVNESVLARWVSGDKSFYQARIMSVTGSMTAPMYTVKFKSYDTIETLRARDIRPLANSNSTGSFPSAAASVTAVGKRKVDGVDSSSVSSAIPTPPPPSTSQPAPPPISPPTHSGVVAPAFSRPIDRFNSGVVSSAAAKLYPKAALLQQENQRVGAGSNGEAGSVEGPPPKKFKKIKATKQLEAGKSKWQEFNSKSKFAKATGKKESMFRTPEGIHGRVGFTGSGQAMRKDPTRSRHVYQPNDDVD